MNIFVALRSLGDMVYLHFGRISSILSKSLLWSHPRFNYSRMRSTDFCQLILRYFGVIFIALANQSIFSYMVEDLSTIGPHYIVNGISI